MQHEILCYLSPLGRTLSCKFSSTVEGVYQLDECHSYLWFAFEQVNNLKGTIAHSVYYTQRKYSLLSSNWHPINLGRR